MRTQKRRVKQCAFATLCMMMPTLETISQWHDLLLSIPTFILPLSLQTVNLGVMWWLALGPEALITSSLSQRDTLIFLDIAAVACIGLHFLFITRACAMGARMVWAELASAGPAYAAGCVATMVVASWLHIRGAKGFSAALWTLSLVIMAFGQFFFLRSLMWKFSTIPSETSAVTTIETATESARPSTLSRLWQLAAVARIVPLAGISAAASTGGVLVHWATPIDQVQSVALFGPLVCGGLWGCFLIPPLYAKVACCWLWHEPTTAILMAPFAIDLVGWLAAVGPDPAMRNSVPTHCLAGLTLLFAVVPILVTVPLSLDPRRPFTPALAAVGFPMEIVAIALIRYHAVLQQASAPIAGAFRIVAFIQLSLATLVSLAIFARFVNAAWRAFHATSHSIELPEKAKSPVTNSPMSVWPSA